MSLSTVLPLPDLGPGECPVLRGYPPGPDRGNPGSAECGRSLGPWHIFLSKVWYQSNNIRTRSKTLYNIVLKRALYIQSVYITEKVMQESHQNQDDSEPTTACSASFFFLLC
jgi:hypothetical protein